jgi:hypothetical protein
MKGLRSQAAGGAREENRVRQTVKNAYEGTVETMQRSADSMCGCGPEVCVTLSACHSQAAQSGWLDVRPRAAISVWNACDPTAAAALWLRLIGACVCAMAPKSEKKMYSNAASVADVRLYRYAARKSILAGVQTSARSSQCNRAMAATP